MKKIKNGITTLLFMVTCLALSSCMNNLGEATFTTKKLADDLYYMEIAGDDGVKGFLEQGGAKSAAEMADYIGSFLGKGPFKRSVAITPTDLACTAFITPDENGGFLAGRNYDWENCTTMILKDTPDDGYASLCTVDLDFLGFGEGFAPKGMVNKIKALAGVFVPLDGINEKGLVVADLMAGDKETTDQQTDKPDLTTTSAIRVLLNYAANVDEAIELLGKYDMHSDIGTAHHLFVADSTGKSVVIEWVNNEMNVKETKVLTNHYLTGEKAGTGSDNSKARFEKITNTLSGTSSMNATQVRDALSSVKASNYCDDESTQWSIVYNMNGDMKETFYWRSNFDKGFEYSIMN